MKVKLTSARFGHTVTRGPNGSKVARPWAQNEGQEVDLPDAEAQALLERGQAVPIKPSEVTRK